ncbi:hypothetical protein A9Q87_11385 [Flavobacteriales bacterium 34_180_T64]|nr:hypothetical protein A9Q87_11385 [Flavobacteriales bacterium 34_180_T64]
MRALVFLFLIFQFSSYSQEKKEFYFDHLGHRITKEYFYSNKKFVEGEIKYLHLVFENDTSTTSVLHPRKVYGKLNKTDLDSLRSKLNSISESNPISYKSHIVINYFSGNYPISLKKPTGWNIYHNDYKRKLDRIIDSNMYWIYNDIEDLKFQRKKRLWVKDEEHFIKNLFFPFHIPYGNFVIIKPDGNYICFYGEYGKQSVWNVAKEIIGN